jgi:hypothetical protein
MSYLYRPVFRPVISVCVRKKILLAFPLDDRIIRTDWDAGFVEGRQYGRGKTGGQVGGASAEGFQRNVFYLS